MRIPSARVCKEEPNCDGRLGNTRRQASFPVRPISQGRQPVSTWCELLWRGTAQQLLDANCRPQVSRQPRLSLARVRAEPSEQRSEEAPSQTRVSPTARKEACDQTLPGQGSHVNHEVYLLIYFFSALLALLICMTQTNPGIANI